ncbi:DUF4129 domain-containing protein [Micromonospora zingiberis]|uniref:DUF4129 domain-containing protein n=1 Tax=Micromonospora zingiberis TaxID=2053011 RepID=A0A4R0GQU4_9ACTN|nr:DUF4129 domain-containing protein [Micromonospora zingiberis]TCB99950.1 DUF4129 domain-containing protein [Micromonospora zingiberis]
MSFSRWWTEATAALGDHLPLPLVALLLVLFTALVAAAWYTYPAWVPRRIPRPRRRRRPARSPRPATAGTADPSGAPPPQPTESPAPSAALADRLAAEGRYDEAVRERLRGMVRDLADRDVVRVRPGMTVTEIVTAATASRPPAGPPLTGAATIFAQVWYAQRPATADHDHRMREHAVGLRRLLTELPETTPDGRGAPDGAGELAR